VLLQVALENKRKKKEISHQFSGLNFVLSVGTVRKPPNKFRIEVTIAHLGRKAAITDAALEWPLFGVAPVVDLQRRVAGECLVADAAGGAAANTAECQWVEWSRRHYGLGDLVHRIAHVLGGGGGEERQG